MKRKSGGLYVKTTTGISALAVAAGLMLAVPASASAEPALPPTAASVSQSTSSATTPLAAAAAALPKVRLSEGQCIPGTLNDGFNTYRYTTTQYNVRYYRYYRNTNPGVEGSAECVVDKYQYFQGGSYAAEKCVLGGVAYVVGMKIKNRTIKRILLQAGKGCALSAL